MSKRDGAQLQNKIRRWRNKLGYANFFVKYPPVSSEL